MRHLKSGRILGRSSAHRKALFRNLVTALIFRERITTTLAKAKELRSHAEKVITLGKKGTLHARRRALRVIKTKEAYQKLFGPLSERFAERNGGYTRILKMGHRRGDDAPMAIIELVDREGDAPVEEPKKGKKAQPKQAEAKKAEAPKEAKPKAKAKKEEKTEKESPDADSKDEAAE